MPCGRQTARGAGPGADPYLDITRLVQDTGFTRTLPADEWLVAFSTVEEAVAGARAIVDDYDNHALAARVIAEEYFDSDRVLAAMLEDAL